MQGAAVAEGALNTPCRNGRQWPQTASDRTPGVIEVGQEAAGGGQADGEQRRLRWQA